MSPLEGQGVPMVPPEDPQLLPDGVFSFGQVVPGQLPDPGRAARPIPSAPRCSPVFSLEVAGQRHRRHPDDAAAGRDPRRLARGREQARQQAAALPARPGARAVHRRQQLRRRADGHRPARRDVRAARAHDAATHQLVVDGLPPPWVAEERAPTRATTSPTASSTSPRRKQLRDVRVTITDVDGPGHRRRAERAQPARRQRRRADLSEHAAVLDAHEPAHAHRLHRPRGTVHRAGAAGR